MMLLDCRSPIDDNVLLLETLGIMDKAVVDAEVLSAVEEPAVGPDELVVMDSS